MLDCSIQTHGQRLHSNYLTVTTTNRENSFNIVVPWNVSTFKDTQYSLKKNILSTQSGIHLYWRSHVNDTLSRFRRLAFGSNWGIQYKRKIHWACCVREYPNDQHWEASLHAYSAMLSQCFLSFRSYCQRIKWRLIPHTKAFYQTNHSQTEKAIRQMQLAYKENCMRNCWQRKDIWRHAVHVGLIQAMNINLPDFPTVKLWYRGKTILQFCLSI